MIDRMDTIAALGALREQNLGWLDYVCCSLAPTPFILDTPRDLP